MTIPPAISGAVAYGGNYQTIPITTRNTPPGGEGPKSIPGIINWKTPPGTNPGSANVVLFNAALQTVAPISQIAGIYIDNSNCQADNITFYFPDTQFEVVVPGFTSGWFPVATNGLQFYIIATNALLGDQTVFNVFNIPIRPNVTDQTNAYQSSFATQILLGNNPQTVQLLSASAILQDLQLTVGFAFGTTSNLGGSVLLEDTNNNILWAGTFGAPEQPTVLTYAELLHWSKISLRVNGLKIVSSTTVGTPGGGSIAINGLTLAH